MGKYLDSIDYNGIVLNTFQLPEKDFYKYYSNVVSGHLADNPDLFDELILAIERRIEWYRDQHKNDYSYDSQGVDEHGNKIKVTHILPFKEADEVEIPFDLPNGIRKINKSFFDNQIKVVNILSIKHNLKTLIHRPKPTKEIQTFEGLFRNKDNAGKVKKIFETRGYTIDGIWQGITREKGELRDAFYVLTPLLKPGKTSTQAKVFYSEFGLKVAPNKEGGYITQRMLTIFPKDHKCKEFDDIFSQLIR